MGRTNPTLVESILGGHFVTGVSPSLQPFIDSATLIISRVITCAASKGITITTEEAEMIERYLAAHFFTFADQLYQSKATNGASGSFQGLTGKGIESSQYGMAALQMDPSGCLAALTKGQRATLNWLGKPPIDQLSASERGYTP